MNDILIPTDPAGVERLAHGAFRELAQKLRDDLGIRFAKIEFTWQSVGTESHPREVVTQVTGTAHKLTRS